MPGAKPWLQGTGNTTLPLHSLASLQYQRAVADLVTGWDGQATWSQAQTEYVICTNWVFSSCYSLNFTVFQQACVLFSAPTWPWRRVFRMPRLTRLPQWVGGMELSPHWLLSDQEDLRSTGATNVPIQVSWSHLSREKLSTQLVSGRHSLHLALAALILCQNLWSGLLTWGSYGNSWRIIFPMPPCVWYCPEEQNTQCTLTMRLSPYLGCQRGPQQFNQEIKWQS